MAPMELTATLLMPVKNELIGLQAILPKIDLRLFVQVLIVDGGSTDGSYEYAKNQGFDVVQLKSPHLSQEMLDAYPYIKGDYIVTFSPDGNCLPELLPKLIEKLKEGHDLIIVSRYLPPAKSYDDDFLTALGNRILTWSISLLGRHKITDALGMYRGYKKALYTLPEIKKYMYGSVLEPLITACANLKDLNICEIPGNEPKRLGGERKLMIFYHGSLILLMIFRMHLYRLKLFLSGFIRNRRRLREPSGAAENWEKN